MSVDLDAIRARHAELERRLCPYDGPTIKQLHADRAALLAEVDQHEARVARFAEDATRWAQGATALRREYEQIKTTVAGLRDHALAETLRADAAQAARDRLAGVVAEDIAVVLWGMDTQDCDRMGAAVLAFLRERLEGRDA